MASQTQPQTKVLRIGIVQDGKIVQERLIKAGEPVFVGESPKNTFVFPPTSLPKRHQLFQPKGKGYVLQFTEEMAGKISYKGGISSLEQLRTQGEATRRSGAFTLSLTEQNRGKVSIGGVTVLFQFVPPPPEPLKAAVRQDFRPKLIDEDDPVFYGFLTLWTALASVLMIYIWNTEPIERTSLDHVPDRFTELVVPPKDTSDEPPPELESEIEEMDGTQINKQETEAVEKDPQETEAAEKPAPDPSEPQEVQQARQQQEMQNEVIQESKLLAALIGTRSEVNNGSRTADLFADSDFAGQNLDAALSSVNGIEVAGDGSVGTLRTGETGNRENASIGDLAQASSNNSASVGSAPTIEVSGTVSTGNADLLGSADDQEAIKKVVRKYTGQVKYCYDGRLKEKPDLEGRVEVSFAIARGRVTSATLVGNTTGDSALGECIVKKVKTWRFPTDIENEVVYPFVLAR